MGKSVVASRVKQRRGNVVAHMHEFANADAWESWLAGQRKGLDQESLLQRYSRRRPTNRSAQPVFRLRWLPHWTITQRPAPPSRTVADPSVTC